MFSVISVKRWVEWREELWGGGRGERSPSASPGSWYGFSGTTHEAHTHELLTRAICSQCRASASLSSSAAAASAAAGALLLVRVVHGLGVVRVKVDAVGGEVRLQGSFRRTAGRDVIQIERLKRRQCAAVDRRG